MEIKPFRIEGHLEANPSKSYLQRALLLASLAGQSSEIQNCGFSGDVAAVMKVIRQLGCTVSGENICIVRPAMDASKQEFNLNVGESGLALRTLAFLSSTFGRPVSLHGEGSLPARPLEPLMLALDQAGISYMCENSRLPLHVLGPVTKHKINIDASFSSQPLSGLLMTLPLCDTDSHVKVKNLNSKPYIDMTLDMMQKFGVRVENKHYTDFYVKGRQKYQGAQIQVEGDWSGAANFLVGAALSGSISVSGLNKNSLQADRAVLEALQLTGTELRWTGDTLEVAKGNNKAFDFDATHCPDLFPPLVLLAAGASGISHVRGINRLRHKESDRLESIIKMFQALGLRLLVDSDILTIPGTGRLTAAHVGNFNDHRMEMLAAMAAVLTDGPVHIRDSGSVGKSYPSFFLHLQQTSRLR